MRVEVEGERYLTARRRKRGREASVDNVIRERE
jgi:hypothetical protein